MEDDSYFLTVLRYIHQNPVKAKLCKKPEEYPFSSYFAYIGGDDLVDTEFALSMLDQEAFISFNNAPNSDCCLDITPSVRKAVTDEQARDIIKKVSHCLTIVEFQSLDEKKKAQFVKLIHKKGVSVRQLSRLTGTTKGMIEKWIK